MIWFRTFFAAGALQVRLWMYSPGNVIVTTLLFPIMYTVIFLLVLQHLNRKDLDAFGIIGPALMGMWATSVGLTAAIVDDERWNGNLETLSILPNNSFSITMFGRTAAASTLSLVALLASWCVARGVFGLSVNIHAPLIFITVTLLTILSAAGIALIVGAILVLFREAVQFQTTLTFPFYLLGGIAFPISVLPDYIQPLAYLTTLSWSSELLRAAMEGDPPRPLAWLMLTLLTLLYLTVGLLLLKVLIRRAQTLGRMGYT